LLPRTTKESCILRSEPIGDGIDRTTRWRANRSVRDFRPAWSRRHGPGLSRTGYAAETRRRGQGAARRLRERSRSPRALSTRSRSARDAESPEHRGGVRARGRGYVLELVEGPTW